MLACVRGACGNAPVAPCPITTGVSKTTPYVVAAREREVLLAHHTCACAGGQGEEYQRPSLIWAELDGVPATNIWSR